MKKYSINILSLAISISFIVGCKKNSSDPDPDPPTPPTPPGDTTIVPGVDPSIANTIGFFLDDWQPKTFTAPSYTG